MDRTILPRIFFSGTFKANPPTANNDDVNELIDARNVKLNPNQFATDAAFRTWLMQSFALGPSTAGNAGWNYFGDSSIAFVASAVTGVQWSDGQVVTDQSCDAIIGQAVQLLGDGGGPAILVDNDPRSNYSTQVLSAQLTVGNTQSQHAAFAGRRPSRCYMRWSAIRNLLLGPSDVGASAVWQAVIAPDAANQFNVAGSPSLQALQQCVTAGQGVALRFAVYLVQPLLNAQQLAQQFASGHYIANPAYGVVVGSINPWTPGELTSTPPGRFLSPGASLKNSFNNNFPTYQLGPALALIDAVPGHITLDLINTIPETTVEKSTITDGGQTLQVNSGGAKVDLQQIFLKLRYTDAAGQTQVQTLATLNYDDYGEESYKKTSGLVDLPYPAELQPHLAGGQFSLELAPDNPNLADPHQYTVAAEPEATVVTDDFAVYLEYDQPGSIDLRVSTRGTAAQAPVTVTVGQYVQVNQPVDYNTPPAEPTQFPNPTYQLVKPSDPLRQPILELPAQLQVVNGQATLAVQPVTPGNPGPCILRYFIGAVQPPDQWASGPLPADFYSFARVLPADNFDQIPDAELTWDLIYDNVLRYYYILYPSMSERIALNDEERVTAPPTAASIILRIQADNWATTQHMPITREMSAGKIKLLTRYLRRFPHELS